MPNKEQCDRAYWDERRGSRTAPLHNRRPECLPCEDAAAYDALQAQWYADLKPAFPEECSYVDDIVFLVWSLSRLDRTEVELYTYIHQDCYDTHPDFPLGQPLAEKPKAFNALMWRFISVRKALDEALAAWDDLRANPLPHAPQPVLPVDPGPEPENQPAAETKQTHLPEIGFVFSTHPEPAHPEPAAIEKCERSP
jgi:hypothetical protein